MYRVADAADEGSLADVQTGLDEAEREAEEARRQSKDAKDRFQDLKKKRCVIFSPHSANRS
jgi:F0F1-type ATP synthase membrane subunit b/b'